MLITNQRNSYFTNIMEKMRATLTPVRRNVARKSTANRPLLNVILKDPLATDNENDYLSKEKTLSTPIEFSSYSADKSPTLGFYYGGDLINSPKVSLPTVNEELNYVENATLELTESLINTSLHEESEEENDDSGGIFSVSEALVKYLNEGLQSPLNYDSSDESMDLSRVQNFPVKKEKYPKSEEYSQSSFSEKVILPPLECKPMQGPGKNIKHEILGNCSDDTKVLPVIATQNSPIKSDGSTTELGTQTVRCLFDPNLESVTCKVKVREEVLLCENVPLKMTILEANFDLDHLENKVEDNNYTKKPDVKSDDEKDVSFMPQVICAMSLGNTDNKSNEAVPQTVEKQKRGPKKTKKVSFNTTENVSVSEKRLTRSQIQVTTSPKRITRNSSKFSLECLSTKDATSVNNSCDDIVDNNYGEKSINNPPSKNKQPSIAIETADNDDSDISKTSEENDDNKKKCILDKKGKKDINEGVLLHVEATKETELMRDGKIIKDKEEYLKDIESKIDKNLPVVVEKEFDIQQSLTEEILLDQALRLAHQRTSPRLSKIMKEAIIKASAPKPSSKSKLPKGNNNKSEIKQKGNKSWTVQKNTSEESETGESILSDSLTSESASEISSNIDYSQKDVEPNEILSKKKTDDYIVAPMIKQSNDEKVVEPLTIKIFRKNNKKKTGFKLSSKNKKSPKKKESSKSKLVHSSDVNMDDLSKTFEDILQDDNWSSNDKDIGSDSISLVNSEEKMSTPLGSSIPNNNINFENSNNVRKDISADLKNVNKEPPLLKISDEIGIRSCHSDKPVKKKAKKPKLTSDSKTVSNEKEIKANTSCNPSNSSNKMIEITSDKNSFDEQLILNKESSIPLLSESEPPQLNRLTSPDKELSLVSSKINGMSSKKIAEAKENNKPDGDTSVRLIIPTSLTVNIDSVANDESTFTTKLDKLSTSQCSSSNAQSKNSDSSSTLFSNSTSSSHLPHQPSMDELAPKNNILMNENENKQLLSLNGVEMPKQNVPSLPINSSNSHLSNQINEKCISSYPEHASDKLKFPVNSPNTDSQPKVLPLSIASRDPRLRKSHVRVIVEVNTCSVSNSPIEKPNIHQETKIVSHAVENVSKLVNISKEADSDAEVNENQLEVERKKKLKKREVDSELLYKTPLSDLHDVPERSSYARSIRKKSPPKTDMRGQRKWNETAISQNAERPSDTYHEYHEINMVYSKKSHYEAMRTEMVNTDHYKRNVFDNTRLESCGSDSQSSEHYSSYRSDEFSSDLRRRENHTKISSDYAHEIGRHSNELSERPIGYQNHSDHRRSSYQDYRRSENFPPDYLSTKNYSRGYKRSNDFSVDHGYRESPDYKEKERVRERKAISHNEPSYSRWDYAHVKGRLPAEVPLHSGPKEEPPPPKDANLWEEERDLIDGPVKNLVRPYYRRKKFSMEELFDRRTDNRRYTPDNDRNYERLWVRKTDQELIHGPDRWERRSRKVFRDSREDRSRSPRRDYDRYGVRRSRSPGGYFKSRSHSSPSPCGSPVVLDSPMSPEPAERFCILEPTKCLTVPQ